MQLALAPGGWALEKRYDCSMTGQRDLRTCCCLPDAAPAASECCANNSCENKAADEPAGGTSLAASGCCRVHWEATPQAGDFDNAVAVRGVPTVPPIAPLGLPVESIPAPRPVVRKEPYPAGVPPGPVPAVPRWLRHCSLLI